MQPNNVSASGILTSTTIQTLLDFDTDFRRPLKRMVALPIPDPPLLLDNERLGLSQLHTFSETELNLLVNLFRKISNIHAKTISPTVYWSVMGKASSFLHMDSKLRTQLSSIFQTGSQDYFTLIEFILSLAVFYQRATFMPPSHLAFEVLNRNNTKIFDTSVFSDLETKSGSDLLFIIKHPGGEMNITRTMFINGWNNFVKHLTTKGPISRDTFIEELQVHPSSEILLFPFLIHSSLESLCAE